MATQGGIHIGVSSPSLDGHAGIDNTVQSSTTDEGNDTPDCHVNHHTERDHNTTLREIRASKKGGDPANDMEARGTFTVTVGRNVIGLAANTMYKTGSAQQSGHKDDGTPDDCNDDPESHVYNNSDTDDIDRPQQPAAEIGQRADKQENTTASNNVQKDDSGLLNNPTYVPGALRQDHNNKESDKGTDVSSGTVSSDESERTGYDSGYHSGDEEEWTLYRDLTIALPHQPGDVPQSVIKETKRAGKKFYLIEFAALPRYSNEIVHSKNWVSEQTLMKKYGYLVLK
uniref:Uncharacterized protein n=1 Tax=Branchiostoma floridae TaxID=7739 RepID=C3Z8A8_BRAFL|eukprot:XP_002595220.1 hypothetical protein BRAFLDRAFT_101802 [Branchiostoma floridae]